MGNCPLPQVITGGYTTLIKVLFQQLCSSCRQIVSIPHWSLDWLKGYKTYRTAVCSLKNIHASYVQSIVKVLF